MQENGQPEQQKMIQIKIPNPAPGIFENAGGGSVMKQLMIQPQPLFVILKTEYPEEGGIYIHKAGGDIIQGPDGKPQLINKVEFLYPEKGFPTPEACQAANIIKRMFIGQVRFIAKFPLLAIFFLRIKVLERWLKEFCSVAEITLAPYFLKDIRYTTFCRELKKFLVIFLQEIGIKEDLDKRAKIFTTLIEYDNAYQLRFEDLANETTAEKLSKNPVKEFKRLLLILKERDFRTSMHERFGSSVFLFSLLMLIPRVRRAFRKALKQIDFSKLQMDEADKYHVLRWSEYKFLGMNDEERHNKFITLHNNNPPKGMILQTLSQQ